MVDDSCVVTQSQAADVSGILPLLVTTDKGARQPAVLLLDVESGEEQARGKKEQDLYVGDGCNRTTPKYSFALPSLSVAPTFYILTSVIFYIFLSSAFLPISHLHFKV